MKLARYMVERGRTAPRLERCEFCALALAAEHGHVIDLASREIRCACHACHMVFQPRGAGRFRAVPTQVVRLRGGALDEIWWNGLDIPVGLAFFFRNSRQQRVVGFYPSPAGPTEAQVSLDFWDDAVAAAPPLAEMEDDVEALLVRRQRGIGVTCWIVPVDACYALTGLVRRHWQGFGGGEAGAYVDGFFDDLAARARDVEIGEGGAPC